MHKTVAGQPDGAYAFIHWNSIEHHDNLAFSPKFEAAGKVLTTEIIPRVGDSLNAFYLETSNLDFDLLEACCCESESLTPHE